MSTNKGNNNRYGHLLDKYSDPTLLEWKDRQQREKEVETRYGDLLDKAKPDYSALEIIAKIEDERIEQQKQMKKDQELERQRNQMRIEEEKRKAEEHAAEVNAYAESILVRKKAKIVAEQRAINQKREAEESQQKMYDRIDSLMKISPEAADAYIQALKNVDAI